MDSCEDCNWVQLTRCRVKYMNNSIRIDLTAAQVSQHCQPEVTHVTHPNMKCTELSLRTDPRTQQTATRYSLHVQRCAMVAVQLLVGLQYSFKYILSEYINKMGDRGSTVVKVLCYKSVGRWFDPSWCQCIFH